MSRPLLLPLVPLYGAALALKRKLFTGQAKRLVQPVISVGSVSAGGAGKTPVVAALARLLMRHGYAVDVLSRGYGRRSSGVERVDPVGDAARFGDEPLLLARLTGAPVYVGANRHAAGLVAEKTAAARGKLVHLLDDGFQHRRLARALDVVLLTAADVADRLLPAGNLREPLARLREAGVIVLREDEAEALRPVVARLAGAAMPVWIIRRRLHIDPPSGRKMPERLLAFCGIARPENFFSMVQATGIELAGVATLRDHQLYGQQQIEGVLDEARWHDAHGFITTEKDAVKLSRPMLAPLEVIGPLIVARLTVEFLNEGEVLAAVAGVAGRAPA